MSKFITLEGIEGVGKTSNRDYIRTILEETGKQCIVTREPGGTPLGESLRELLLQHSDEQMSDDAELLMMFAARAEHIKKVIQPALEVGQYVLCDRFTEATYAYQGGGRQLDVSKIADLEAWVQGELRPDLTIILDAPVDVGRERAGKRSAPDRIEKEKNDFFERVRNAYLDLARQHPERICTVDASVDLEQVQVQIKQQLQDREII
ncbi:MAG: dTMP kinase [Gammaproteobacteria bacterium]|nr:dTMP kinase [Gammaproteobacteria bacterium]MCW8923248.1 dTMP kinase [Gammaproteobacteria bacterium]